MSARPDPMDHPSRRAILVAGLAVGGGLALGFAPPARAAEKVAVKPFIRIAPDGQVTFILPYVEMGQGAYTSQVQILAEELEVDPATVLFEAAPPDEALYASPLFGGQITGGSGSLRGAWMTLRPAAAAARTMLVETAAERWGVSPTSCRAADGGVVHAPSGRRFGYGVLATAAAARPVPQEPKLKPVAAFRTVGKPLRRLDTPGKIDGSARFGIDARPQGLRYAMVQAAPVFGGTLASVDGAAAMKITGVRQIVKLSDAVAVVADNTWAARKGLDALKVRWNEGPNAKVSTATLRASFKEALTRKGLVSTATGDVAEAERAAKARYEAEFELPMLAHAPMEPLNCTVHVRTDRCEVWCGSQSLGRAQQFAAEAAGLPLSQVAVHNLLLGGGFGRRLESDYVAQAVKIGKQVSGPVKVTWSREEDIRQDYFRYHNHSRVMVGLDAAGRPVSWRHKLAGPNVMARFLPINQKDGVDLDIIDDASGPYDIPNVHIEFVRQEAPPGLRTGNWRGVGPTRNVFIVESVMDELARRAGADPVAYRRALMTGAPRARAVLDLAVEKSGWGKPLPARTGRGVSVFNAFGSYLATVAEVRVTTSGDIRVDRIVCALDTGLVVNPDVVRAQIEGGVIFGLSAALYGRITVANGRVEQGNFDTYRVLRMREAPAIEVHIVDSTEDPGGVGEPGTAGAIAAVANAVAAATGHRPLSLPLVGEQLRSA
ncbi:MAG: aldehyde dehydrogenase [Phenylobacterium zucineum]|nr:MAG: aldehyde dehydrogenase [Phenylobacterium zucineum]